MCTSKYGIFTTAGELQSGTLSADECSGLVHLPEMFDSYTISLYISWADERCILGTTVNVFSTRPDTVIYLEEGQKGVLSLEMIKTFYSRAKKSLEESGYDVRNVDSSDNFFEDIQSFELELNKDAINRIYGRVLLGEKTTYHSQNIYSSISFISSIAERLNSVLPACTLIVAKKLPQQGDIVVINSLYVPKMATNIFDLNTFNLTEPLSSFYHSVITRAKSQKIILPVSTDQKGGLQKQYIETFTRNLPSAEERILMQNLQDEGLTIPTKPNPHEVSVLPQTSKRRCLIPIPEFRGLKIIPLLIVICLLLLGVVSGVNILLHILSPETLMWISSTVGGAPALLLTILNGQTNATELLPTASNYSITITSHPEGADIYIDEGFKGQTPSSILLADGIHLITVIGNSLNESNYTITILSQPEGADIYIDEELKGQTPSSIYLSAGTHQITVSKPEWIVNSKEITIPYSDLKLIFNLTSKNIGEGS